jgi:hypothetical protein
MAAPLVSIVFPSIYKASGEFVPVPKRMASCTPDTKAALLGLKEDVAAAGGTLRLSDLFRSRDMQLQANLDFVSGKKAAFSPPPGGSMHEAGRAFDIDLGSLGPVTLARFWELARAHGVVPIIGEPRTTISEAWHFECRGSTDLVRAHYAAGKGTNMKPARAMAAAGIAAVGIELDGFQGRNREIRLQSGLIRLGADPGNIDGSPGKRTRDALAALGIGPSDLDAQLAAVETLLAERFPAEWFDKSPLPEEIGAMA